MRWNSKLLFITLFSILLIGLIHIPFPLQEDQSFFLLGAKEMDAGKILYQDFWDIKQPGIFIFYLAAGKIFGFNQVGIHTFELCYWFAFSIFMLWSLKTINCFKNEFFVYLSPLIVTGSYYALSNSFFSTQVEALVNFPLLMVITFNQLSLQDNKRKYLWLILSGIAGGTVLFFKLIFAPILLSFWIHLFLRYRNKNQGETISNMLLSLGMIPLGVILLWLPFMIYCIHYEILRLCYDIFFKYPLITIQNIHKPGAEYLINSFKEFSFKLIFFSPFIIFSAFIQKHLIKNSLWIWLVSSLFVIIIQRTSWHSSHFQILYTPVILLTVISTDHLLNWSGKKYSLKLELIPILVLTCINIPALLTLGKKTYKLSQYHFGLRAHDRLAFSLTNKYNETAYLASRYIFGEYQKSKSVVIIHDPLINYYTNLNQETSQSGWSIFIPGKVDILLDEIKSKKPEYIFIKKLFYPFFNNQGKHVMCWINKNYKIGEITMEGTWYKLSN